MKNIMRRRKKTNTLPLIIAIASVAAVTIIIFVIIRILFPSPIKAMVEIEAGSELVAAKAFLIDSNGTASYVTDIFTLDTNTVGDKQVTIQVGDKNYKSVLRVIDTVYPTAATLAQTIGKGEKPEAAIFVTDITDATAVKVNYKRTPDFNKAGEQEVELVLEDGGGNRTELSSKLYIIDIKPNISIEAGSDLDIIKANDFINNFDENGNTTVSFGEDITKFNSRVPGSYDVTIEVNGAMLTSRLVITDTTPPSATAARKEIWLGETAQASDFVTEIKDVSAVKSYFKEEPDYSKTGDQTVCIILEDTHLNKTELYTTLTISLDTEPPVINGAINHTIFLGDKISYKNNVTATDNKDGDVEFTVNSSSVNVYELGTYQAVYSAVDAAGNRTSKTITVDVIDLDPDIVYALADDVLAQITTPEMTLLEKAKKIHEWVKRNVKYTSAVDKENALKGAYYGFKNRQGDCFTFYAVSEVLLTRAGIENMRVTRVGGITQHFWNLVNVGEGWYHFDTCPVRISINTFMFTDADAADYTQRITYLPNYYIYDKTLYPEAVQE